MPAFTDWVGMVEGNASMYLASPRIAEKVTGEVSTLEEMGGARMHATVSGCADEVFSEDWQVIGAARLLLSYLPDNWQERPAMRPAVDPARPTWPVGLIPDDPNAAYDVLDVIERLVDADSFFEIKAGWAQELVTGLGRVDGRTIGIVANQPKVRAGAIFVDSADKAARFISLCDAFNIPLVFLQDVPGFMVGVAVERQGIIRHGAKMIRGHVECAGAAVHRRAPQGVCRGLLCDVRPGFEPRATLALPTASIGTMSAEASVNAVYANKIAAIEDPKERAAFVAARIAEQEADFTLLRMASELVVDAVVQPRGAAWRAEQAAACSRRVAALDDPAPSPCESGVNGVGRGRLAPRSLFFVPATRPELLAKVTRWRPDVTVVDLEDAVPADQKTRARTAVVDAVERSRCPNASRAHQRAGDPMVRGRPRRVAATRAQGVVLPKYESADQLDAVRNGLAGRRAGDRRAGDRPAGSPTAGHCWPGRSTRHTSAPRTTSPTSAAGAPPAGTRCCTRAARCSSPRGWRA